VSALDVESLRTCLEEARHEVIIGWNEDESHDPEAPRHLMNALLNIELGVEMLEQNAEIVRLTAENQCLRAELDACDKTDEPSVSDVRAAEAPDVDIKGMVSALAAKRHGAT
jgi:hypothetical protein